MTLKYTDEKIEYFLNDLYERLNWWSERMVLLLDIVEDTDSRFNSLKEEYETFKNGLAEFVYQWKEERQPTSKKKYKEYE